MTPVFLAKYKERILHSGKYLNVIRECGKDIRYPLDEEFIARGLMPREEGGEAMQVEGGRQYDFYEPIEKAYQWSSDQLLQLIFGECQLIKRLESIKHYFFLDKGDFFLHFFDYDSEDIFD